MERIGIAASKMAKGNIVLYNVYVVLIAFLFALFLFFIAGSSIVLALVIIGYLVTGILPNANYENDWITVIKLCLGLLSIVVGIFLAFAMIRNLKLNSNK